jgi:hypothetical protein
MRNSDVSISCASGAGTDGAGACAAPDAAMQSNTIAVDATLVERILDPACAP